MILTCISLLILVIVALVLGIFSDKDNLFSIWMGIAFFSMITLSTVLIVNANLKSAEYDKKKAQDQKQETMLIKQKYNANLAENDVSALPTINWGNDTKVQVHTKSGWETVNASYVNTEGIILTNLNGKELSKN